MSETFDPGQDPAPQGTPGSGTPAPRAPEASPGPAAPNAPGETPSAATPPSSGDSPTWVIPPSQTDPGAPGQGAAGPWTNPGQPWGTAGPWAAPGQWVPPHPGDPAGGRWIPPTGQNPSGSPWVPPGAHDPTTGAWIPQGQWSGGGPWGGGRWPPHWPGGPGWIPPQPPPSRPHPLRVLAVAIAVVVVAAVGVAVGRTSINTGGTGFGNVGGNASQSTNPPRTVSPASATIAAKVDPGIVDVNTQLGYEDGEAAGTGMVLTSSGIVLTNNHVVAESTQVSVTDVGNGKTYSATVVGEDPSDDVAVIKLTGASGLKTVPLGDSSTVAEGDPVTAIGNAGGVGGTPSVSSGNVVALDQSITASDQSDDASEQLNGLIQTDASLQPGDSGGPLVNANGKVVGMDTAASTGFQFQQGSSQGFSIPINTALGVAHQIMAGHATAKIHVGASALLGVVVQDTTSSSGARVVQVEPGTPADGAGITQGDLITSLGGHTVTSASGLTALMQQHHPGDQVQVGWVDSVGQQHAATVQLASGPTI